MVNALDSQSTGPRFDSLSGHLVDLFLVRPEFKSSAMLVSSQLLCLLPVGIITHITFYLNYCFIIPEKPDKGSR